MRRSIYSTDEVKLSPEEQLEDSIKELQANFDYAIDGINKLLTDGMLQDAEECVNSLAEAVNISVSTIAYKISESSEIEE